VDIADHVRRDRGDAARVERSRSEARTVDRDEAVERRPDVEGRRSDRERPGFIVDDVRDERGSAAALRRRKEITRLCRPHEVVAVDGER